MPIAVCYYPTSKWNIVCSRSLASIEKAKPLIDYEAVINLIRRIRTRAGWKLKVN